MSESTSLSLLQQMRAPATAQAAWDQFAGLYEPLLDHWLRQRGIPLHTADDIRQDVLLTVSQQIEGFEHNGRTGAFRNWLRKILAHRLRTATRRYHREATRREPGLMDLGEELTDPHSELTQRWNREHDEFILQQLLQLVAPRFQECSFKAFEKVIIHGQEAAAVAAELGITVNAVRIAQSRILAALREVGAEFID